MPKEEIEINRETVENALDLTITTIDSNLSLLRSLKKAVLRINDLEEKLQEKTNENHKRTSNRNDYTTKRQTIYR